MKEEKGKMKEEGREKRDEGRRTKDVNKIELDKLEHERLLAKEKEAGEYLDRLKRLQAEYENARKRLAREKSEFLMYSNEELLGRILPVVDSFDRALAQFSSAADRVSGLGFRGSELETQDPKPEPQTGSHHGGPAILEGVRLIRKQLEDVLLQSGLKPVDTIGKPFDARQHESVAQVPSDTVPEHIILEEVQRGWFLFDRLLRPALVKVSAGRGGAGADREAGSGKREATNEGRSTKNGERNSSS
ncbi:MAG: nucleotide exchange factor GrpE [Candidatus Omnitrophica bacterium]|nr:nucleotide exchange factor GrpE [Candidatus Omnitrophota bacterium]